jgi:hypothetical protein
LCNDSNPCNINGVCDPAAANTTSGCISQKKVCGNSSYCSNHTCLDYTGCVSLPRDCSNNATTNSSCTTYNCSETQRACVALPAPCFNFLAAVGGIVGGALAGIIIAAAIVAGCSVAGGAYAVSQALNTDEDGMVINNPVYESAQRGGENPIHTHGY